MHDTVGSSNPIGLSGNYDRIAFAPYYLFKDLITIYNNNIKNVTKQKIKIKCS